MGKDKKFDPNAIEGKTVKSTTDLGNGFTRITWSDGTSSIVQIVPISMTVVVEGKGKKAAEKEEEEDEEDEEEVSLEDMKEALIEAGTTKKELKKMSDEEIEEAYNDLEEEDEEDEDEDDSDEDEDSDDDDDDDSDDEEEEDEDSGITKEELKEADFDDLEDMIDDNEFDIDIEDYDADDKKSVEKLRKAVAKAAGIKL